MGNQSEKKNIHAVFTLRIGDPDELVRLRKMPEVPAGQKQSRSQLLQKTNDICLVCQICQICQPHRSLQMPQAKTNVLYVWNRTHVKYVWENMPRVSYVTRLCGQWCASPRPPGPGEPPPQRRPHGQGGRLKQWSEARTTSGDRYDGLGCGSDGVGRRVGVIMIPFFHSTRRGGTQGNTRRSNSYPTYNSYTDTETLPFHSTTHSRMLKQELKARAIQPTAMSNHAHNERAAIAAPTRTTQHGHRHNDAAQITTPWLLLDSARYRIV